MKLIINIPDNIYDAIKEAQTIISGQRSGKTLLQILVNSVENGTPLPKGHGRLIDADAISIDQANAMIKSYVSHYEANKGEWIPVSERLPEKFSFVNCTCHSLIDDREDWVVETVYVPQPSNSPYSDWGNIPMLNDRECEVIAWMYREIPEPYKKEGE